VGSAALETAGIDRRTVDPPGGVIDRDAAGEPTGVVRENAAEMVRCHIPEVDSTRVRDALAATCAELSTLGVTSVHGLESADDLELLGALRALGRLPLRVSAFLPLARLEDLVARGVRSGDGDDHLRIWGVKLFLDGSLGSDTAEMLDGSGVVVVPQNELLSAIERSAEAGLNVAIHAIGDGAVRRCLDALELHRAQSAQSEQSAQSAPSPTWRPRIEHAQCVDSQDAPRFARIGVIASMQPVHAVSDRALAERRWGDRCAYAYPWGLLRNAGAVLAFGSDAPVDDPAPLHGIAAATSWRHTAGWYPQLAVNEATAVDAYTRNAAYAVGMEDRLGSLTPGQWCDLSVVEGDAVVATVLGGEVIGAA
jgi:predicted amidohydrolase YtcJ